MISIPKLSVPIAFSLTRSITNAYELGSKLRKQFFKSNEAKKSKSTSQAKFSFNIDANEKKKAYVHPYHSDKFPIYVSIDKIQKLLYEAMGPEQVSPHYESWSRSRRLVLFTFGYISYMMLISSLGGMSANEWLDSLLFEQGSWVLMFLILAEMRQHTWLIGPKYSEFYNTYNDYEIKQLMESWMDSTEKIQLEHMEGIKVQIEYYTIIHKDFELIKQRSIANFLVHRKLLLEKQFRDRSRVIIRNIIKMEEENLKEIIKKYVLEAYDTAYQKTINDKENFQIKCFDLALKGLKSGKIEYEGDIFSEILKNEIKLNMQKLKELSSEDKQKLLMLNENQRKHLVTIDAQYSDQKKWNSENFISENIRKSKPFKELLDEFNLQNQNYKQNSSLILQ